MTDEPTVTNSRIVYENPWMRLREDNLRLPDGSAGLYGVVEKPDFATVVPIHADGRIELVEQYRHPVGRRLWELPMGALNDRPDATPEEIARTELREETGLTAGHLEHVHQFFQAPGYATQTCHLFVATDLRRGSSDREAGEQDMRLGQFTIDEVMAMIQNGQFGDGVSIAALGYLRLIGRI